MKPNLQMAQRSNNKLMNVTFCFHLCDVELKLILCLCKGIQNTDTKLIDRDREIEKNR